jgi:class 3 adenylate cyclase
MTEVPSQTICICLSDIEGFESMIARMPTQKERGQLRIAANVPVLVMQRHGGHKQLFRADGVTLTIDSTPPPAAWDVHDAVRYVLDCILEDLASVLSDMEWLNAAMTGPQRNLVKIAAEFQERPRGRTERKRRPPNPHADR